MSLLQNIFFDDVVQLLGWTLIHFLWQGATVTLIFLLILRLSRNASSNFRYLAGVGALFLMLLCSGVTAVVLWNETDSIFESSSVDSSPAVLTVSDIIETRFDTSPDPRNNRFILDAEVANGLTGMMLETEPANLTDKLSEVIVLSIPYVVTAWALGVLILSTWHIGSWFKVQLLKFRSILDLPVTLTRKWRSLAEQLGINRRIQFLKSKLVKVPTVIGWLRPVILVPASMISGMDSEQLQAVILHELAHIRRYDYLVNLIQIGVETIYFFHPAVWWVSSKIRLERENCCDDMAISVIGDKLFYARALTEVADQSMRPQISAVAADGGSLNERLSRLISLPKRQQCGFGGAQLPLLFIILIILVIPSVWADEFPSATELLDKYAEYQEKIGSCISYTCLDFYAEYRDAEISFGVDAPPSLTIPAGRFEQWSHVRYEHDKLRIMDYKTPSRPINQRWRPRRDSELFPEDIRWQSSWLWRGNSMIWNRISNDSTYPNKVTFSHRKPYKDLKVNYKSECWDRDLWGFYRYDPERVDAVLRNAKIISVRKRLMYVGGAKCYVIDAATERGKYTVWIDPERGYNIVQALILRKPGDLRITDPLKVLRTRYHLSDIRLEQVDDLWIPVEGKYEHKMVERNKKVLSYQKDHLRRNEIKINPTFTDEDFEPDDVLDWSQVSFGESNSILDDRQFYWHNDSITDFQGRVFDKNALDRPYENILYGKALPDFNTLGIYLNRRSLMGKRLLIHFCDMNEMHGWYSVIDLVNRHQQFKDNGIETVLIQTPPLPPGTLRQWERKWKTMPWPLPFKVNMVDTGDIRKAQQWGIRRLPWTILTDQKHIVTAEGFSLPLLLGKPMPDLRHFGMQTNLVDLSDKRLLLCIGDLAGSWTTWNCMKKLAERAPQLRKEDVEVFIMQAPKQSELQLKTMWNSYNEGKPFDLPLLMTDKRCNELAYDWTGNWCGDDPQPWLILTNEDHIVTAERFTYLQLDEKLKEIPPENLNELPLMPLQKSLP